MSGADVVLILVTVAGIVVGGVAIALVVIRLLAHLWSS